MVSKFVSKLIAEKGKQKVEKDNSFDKKNVSFNGTDKIVTLIDTQTNCDGNQKLAATFMPIHDGGDKKNHTSFSSVTSTNV